MNIDEQNLQQITIDVCQSMLGLELKPIRSDIDIAQQLVASVEISGARHTAVEVFAHDDLMAAIAEAMFCSDRASLSEEEIRDAFGEIANMIGGNVKGVFGSDDELSLSLPTVGKAHDTLNRLPSDCVRTTFECCGHPLSIVLRDVAPQPQPVDASTVL